MEKGKSEYTSEKRIEVKRQHSKRHVIIMNKYAMRMRIMWLNTTVQGISGKAFHYEIVGITHLH